MGIFAITVNAFLNTLKSLWIFATLESLKDGLGEVEHYHLKVLMMR